MPTQRELQIVKRAARRHGIAPRILYGLWGAESNFRGAGESGPESSAGAQGPFQFMPATAAAYGINPHNFRQSANAAAKYLSQYEDRGIAGMLAAYNAGPAGNPNNPETQAYIPKVRELAQQWPGARGGGGGGDRGGKGGGGNAGPLMAAAGAGPRQMPQGSEGTLALLSALQGGQEAAQAPSSAGVPLPAFAAGPVLAGGQAGSVSGGAPTPKPDVSALLAAIQTTGGGIERAGSPGVVTQPGGGGGGGGGGRQGGGGGVKVQGPLREMFYNGPGGINIDEGKQVGRGFVSGHEGHVHVAADNSKTAVRLGKLAQRMGLTVREHPKFDPVDPVHTEGSFHYSNKAIDVSGDPRLMRKFNRRVAKIYGLR